MEGAKVRIQALDVYPEDVATVNGELEFSSVRPQTVSYVRLRLLERYERGRGDNKKIDEYELGKWVHTEPFVVRKDEPKILFFALPFELLQSKMDQRQNSLLGFAARLAKTLYGVQSDYRLEVEALVDEVNRTISDKKSITFSKVHLGNDANK